MKDTELKPDEEPKKQSQIKMYFPKGFLLLIVLFIVMSTTNPTRQEYITWTKEQEMAQNGNNSLLSGIVSLFSNPIIDSATTTTNCLLFTIFTTKKMTGNGKPSVVIGLFHNFIPLPSY